MESQAQHAVRSAIKKGSLELPSSCAICGLPRYGVGTGSSVIYHHADYSQPLMVVGLCKSCHGKTHTGRLPEVALGRYGDLIAGGRKFEHSVAVELVEQAFDHLTRGKQWTFGDPSTCKVLQSLRSWLLKDGAIESRRAGIKNSPHVYYATGMDPLDAVFPSPTRLRVEREHRAMLGIVRERAA